MAKWQSRQKGETFNRIAGRGVRHIAYKAQVHLTISSCHSQQQKPLGHAFQNHTARLLQLTLQKHYQKFQANEIGKLKKQEKKRQSEHAAKRQLRRELGEPGP